MIRWVVILVVFASASGVFVHVAFPRKARAIAISLHDETGGGTNYVPAVNGYASRIAGSSAHKGAKEIYCAYSSYQVSSALNGRFIVEAHYIIERNGISREFRRTLLVSERIPIKAKETKIDAHLLACAYLSQTTLAY